MEIRISDNNPLVWLRDFGGDVFHDIKIRDREIGRKCPHVAMISITDYGCCSHRCPMCYARGARNAFEKHYPKYKGEIVVHENTAQKLEEAIQKSRILPSFYISQSTDPLQPISEVREVTFEVIKVLMKYKLSFHISTKNAEGALALIYTIPELKDYHCWHLSMTIESPPDKQMVTSPGASPIEERFKALKRIHNMGVRIVGRTDPTILGFVTVDEVCENIRKFREAGAEHITGSLGFYTPIAMKGLREALARSRWRNCIPAVAENYGVDIDKIKTDKYSSRKIFRAPMRTREKFHKALREVVESYNMTYAVCLELPKEYDSPGIRSCEGKLNKCVHIKKQDGNFYPIPNCVGDCNRCSKKGSCDIQEVLEEYSNKKSLTPLNRGPDMNYTLF